MLLIPALPTPAAAHPLNEYVQNTYIDLAPNGATIEMDMTPGVLVASGVIEQIDSNGDGEISKTEGEAYARGVVQRDISLKVDGEPQKPTLLDSSFPKPLDMKAGLDAIRLQIDVGSLAGSPGQHEIVYRNDHEPVNSAYLVNAFETGDRVEIAQQERGERQHGIKVNYTIASPNTQAASSSGEQANDVRTSDDISERGQRLAAFLRQGEATPWLLLAGFCLSALLGGLHALTPGHG